MNMGVNWHTTCLRPATAVALVVVWLDTAPRKVAGKMVVKLAGVTVIWTYLACAGSVV
jgi:hypothetical protein